MDTVVAPAQGQLFAAIRYTHAMEVVNTTGEVWTVPRPSTTPTRPFACRASLTTGELLLCFPAFYFFLLLLRLFEA